MILAEKQSSISPEFSYHLLRHAQMYAAHDEFTVDMAVVEHSAYFVAHRAFLAMAESEALDVEFHAVRVPIRAGDGEQEQA